MKLKVVDNEPNRQIYLLMFLSGWTSAANSPSYDKHVELMQTRKSGFSWLTAATIWWAAAEGLQGRPPNHLSSYEAREDSLTDFKFHIFVLWTQGLTCNTSEFILLFHIPP